MKLPVMAAEHLSQLQAFEAKILCNHAKIEAWFRSQWNAHRPPFYGSVDIRNAGYKISSIDMNLFPGGFNNLNPNFIPLAAVAAQDAVQRACETAKSVLIIPENHTRNTFYLQNVYALSEILRSAGYEVRLGSLNPEVTEPTEFETALGDKILLEPLLRTRERVHLADGFSPCVVLLNNDLSAGVPDILKGISQTVLPPLHGGWTTRRKTEHFSAYNQVAAEFAKLIDVDEWENLVDIGNGPVISGDYIFYYCFSITEEVQKFLRSVSKKTGMPVYFMEAKEWTLKMCWRNGIRLIKSYGPDVYMNMVKHAKLFITSSFHGTAFGTLYRKNFWYIRSKHSETSLDDRASSFLTQLGLMSRYRTISELSKIDLFAPADYSTLPEKLEPLRKLSFDYLQSVVDSLE